MRPALLALLVALPAHATWRSAQILGTPTDVDTVDAGMAVVSSADPSGAMSVFAGSSDAGFGAQLSFIGDFVSATWRPPSCLIGLLPNATLLFSGSCPVVSLPLNGAAVLSGRLRSVPSGAIYAYAWRNFGGGTLRVQRTDPTRGTLTGDWSLLTPGFIDLAHTESPLSVLSIPNGAEYAAWAYSPGAGAALAIALDGGTFRTFAVGGIRDVALFDRDGGPAALVVNDGGQVLLNDALTTGAFSATNAPLRPYRTVSFSASGGSANGIGFGMLTVGNQIYSPVPNPNALGRDWVLRTEDAGFVGPIVRATCHDPRFCVAITSSTTGPNVFAYFNDFAPASDLRPAVVPLGGTATYVLDAGDRDGDPIWVTWVSGGYSWDGGDPRSITVVAPPVGSCGAVTMANPLVAMLSDGLAAHDRQITIPVTVTGMPPQIPALLSMPASLDFTAGDPAASVVVSYPPDSGCTIPALSWSIAPDGGLFGLVPEAAGVSVTPPSVFCRDTPQTFTLSGVGSADASVSLPVTVRPWGKPNAPVFIPATVTQPAGTDAGYGPDASAVHVCQSATNFPSTELIWTIDAGVPGVTVATSANQLAVFSTNACVTGTVFALATRRLNTIPPQLSDLAGSLRVQLVPTWTQVTSFDAGFSYDATMSRLVGSFGTNGSCEADRFLRANVIVTRPDGGSVSSKDNLGVPGGWSVDVTGGCSGGSFLATASLTDDAGARYGPTARYAFDTGRIEARVPALKVSLVPVSCEHGASAELELDVLPTDCALQQFSWTQDHGPALVVSSDGGSRLRFATLSQDLQTLAGQELGWSVTATVGADNTATASRRIRMVPTRFVQIAHRTDVPVAREEEAVGVEVTLTNSTACAVTGAVLRESLGGLDPILGSVRLAGVTREASVVGDEFVVADLSLPASGSIRITYLAKVPLLAAARPTGKVMLTGTDVTLTATALPAAGCGCNAGSGGGGFLLLALAAAFVRTRRRSV